MKVAFYEGVRVRGKCDTAYRGDPAATATIVRYDGEGFYVIRRDGHEDEFIAHEDDLEVAE